MSIQVVPEGSVPRRGAATATVNFVSPRYFDTLRIRVKKGRVFTDRDRRGSPAVVIVSESVARNYFAAGALGRRLRIPAVNFALTDAQPIWAEIVGIVDNVTVTSVGEKAAEHIYAPEAQDPVRFTYVLLRTDRDPLSFVTALRRAVHAESPITPLDEAQLMEERAASLTASPRRAMWLLGFFAALAGILSASGIYAVSAYLAAQRKREIAIRMAVGASPFSLLGAMCQKTLSSLLLGILLGLLGAVALTRFLNSLLFGVGHLDPLTYAAASVALFVCALLAMIRPALRGLTIDVASTLKQD